MASLLSHELNQPLAAISSYATGSMNLMREGQVDAETQRMIGQALARIAEQAERASASSRACTTSCAGASTCAKRPRRSSAGGGDALVRLQARKSGTRIELDLPTPPQPMPRVMCDRTMIEQVLLNLTATPSRRWRRCRSSAAC